MRINLPRHDVDTHPATSGQLSVITILGQHQHVNTTATNAVRARQLIDGKRHRFTPGRLEQIISDHCAAHRDTDDQDTVRMPRVLAAMAAL